MAATLQTVINTPQSDRLKNILRMTPRFLDVYFAIALRDVNNCTWYSSYPTLEFGINSFVSKNLFSLFYSSFGLCIDTSTHVQKCHNISWQKFFLWGVYAFKYILCFLLLSFLMWWLFGFQDRKIWEIDIFMIFYAWKWTNLHVHLISFDIVKRSFSSVTPTPLVISFSLISGYSWVRGHMKYSNCWSGVGFGDQMWWLETMSCISISLICWNPCIYWCYFSSVLIFTIIDICWYLLCKKFMSMSCKKRCFSNYEMCESNCDQFI